MFLKNCHTVYKKNCNSCLYNMCKVEAVASDDNIFTQMQDEVFSLTFGT